ncbi:hypothetical protein GCM10011309_07140 [Litorimonas cladophorae]|jgi:hypothetical protein|uniref:Uncharacterized protein n=1 Tax=Litorimonas cladophorae TaxID=1220491 RepID=A0A918KG84_9PROT|nr:hypothetical protein [Litorimonas cladophorae]GGX59906.1 hypothetical protein GCM10011309_07140 [Litorimonas cladophorae]
MKLISSILAAAVLSTAFAAPAFAASPDVYVVNFRNAQDTNSMRLDGQLASALAISGVNAEEVVIDTSTAAKWEKGAHEAFDRDIVPVFNQWVGLPGFAAVVDAKSKRVIGCVNGTFTANEMAEKIRQMASTSTGSAYMSRASVSTKTTRCPAAHNVDPGGN